MEQIAGLAWVTGLPDGPPVAPRGACDPLAGVHAAFAVAAALAFTDRTGAGQLVELPMIESVLNATAVQPLEFEVFGVTMGRRGNRSHGAAVQNLYRCAGDDEWIAVTAATDEQWQALVELIGAPARADGADEIDAWLADWFAGQRLYSVVERLAAAGIPAAPVVSPSLVTDNPQLIERGFFESLEHPRTGVCPYPRPPFAPLDGRERWLRRPPPTLGQHNGEVLRDLCGVSNADFARLVADRVIGTRPTGV
jgi:crotonobetainyl-CoA:carnitine CoA-transferase CaiB-like acyl-CoA transferase